jgi:hypothetical protein
MDPRYLDTMTEDELDANFLDYCKVGGWLTYHTHDSRRSEGGFPDRVAVRGGRILFAELKTATGRVSPKQKIWLAVLGKLAEYAPGVIFVRLWRPANIGEMQDFLRPWSAPATGRTAAGAVDQANLQ